MATHLTPKQKKFVRGYLETGNGTEAALKAYDIQGKKPERVAAAVASENLTKPNIVKAIQESLPDDLLAKVHLEGLEATMEKYVGEEGWIEVPDYSTRHRYLDSAYKIKGTYAPTKTANLNANIDLSTDDTAIDLDLLVKEAEAKLKDQKTNG